MTIEGLATHLDPERREKLLRTADCCPCLEILAPNTPIDPGEYHAVGNILDIDFKVRSVLDVPIRYACIVRHRTTGTHVLNVGSVHLIEFDPCPQYLDRLGLTPEDIEVYRKLIKSSLERLADDGFDPQGYVERKAREYSDARATVIEKLEKRLESTLKLTRWFKDTATIPDTVDAIEKEVLSVKYAQGRFWSSVRSWFESIRPDVMSRVQEVFTSAKAIRREEYQQTAEDAILSHCSYHLEQFEKLESILLSGRCEDFVEWWSTTRDKFLKLFNKEQELVRFAHDIFTFTLEDLAKEPAQVLSEKMTGKEHLIAEGTREMWESWCLANLEDWRADDWGRLPPDTQKEILKYVSKVQITRKIAEYETPVYLSTSEVDSWDGFRNVTEYYIQGAAEDIITWLESIKASGVHGSTTRAINMRLETIEDIPVPEELKSYVRMWTRRAPEDLENSPGMFLTQYFWEVDRLERENKQALARQAAEDRERKVQENIPDGYIIVQVTNIRDHDAFFKVRGGQMSARATTRVYPLNKLKINQMLYAKVTETPKGLRILDLIPIYE